MKKILPLFTVLIMLIGMGTSAVFGNPDYVIADVVSLTNFLSCKSDTVNDKNYDLNNDGVWDIFDLCLLRRAFLNNSESSMGTRVKVTMNDTIVYANINNTKTGKAFLELLPFKVSGYRSSADICCSVSEKLPNDPSENEAWNIGEIGWFGGWFTILCENEEQFSNPDFAIIGKFEDEYIDTVTSMKGNIDFIVELAEPKSYSDVAVFDLESGKNQNAPTVLLNSGYEMPVAGIGTYSLHDDTCVASVKSALEQGVRLIDTAYMYGNEAEVGKAVRESGIPREDIFVITKIYPGEQFKNPEKAIQDALDKLDIDYIDMMLLHHPGDNDVNAYLAMEKFVKQGKIRSLGLSNWYIEEIDDFISQVNIKPALVQNEIHPYYQERKVVNYMHDLGIVMQAWYPLGGRGHQKELLNDETILKIAETHGKSAAQVILRWDLQNGVVVIPGSSNLEHILENISIFDFSLTDKEMSEIDSLNRDEKHDWY